MDQYIGPYKSATYLHPSPSGPFLELKSEPMKPPSPATSALLHHNPSLIDLCTFNSLCQRFMENSPSSSTSPYKPFINPAELYFCLPPIPKLDYSQQLHENPSKVNVPAVGTALSISSASECSPNVSSNTSTPYSSPKVKHLLQQPSPLDLHMARNGPRSNSTSQSDPCRVSDLVDKVEQMSETSSDRTRDWLSKDAEERKLKAIPSKPCHTSPILHRLLATPSQQLNEILVSNHLNDSVANDQNPSSHCQSKSPPLHASHRSNKSKSSSHNSSHKHCTSTQPTNRSPIFSSRLPKHHEAILDHDTSLSQGDSSTSLLSANSHDDSNLDNVHLNNGHKRPLEFVSAEQMLAKRRYHRSAPTILMQQEYCIAYPANIPRCVDCQTANPIDFSMHLAGCRFQHCRTLKSYDDHSYEVDGFPTAVQANAQDTEPLCKPNACDQPPLNLVDAHYIFTQIAKLFSLMFLHEQTERSTQNEATIIWKRYMAGWREVCDECFTTLFNYHYMCQQCGYMVCIECSNQFAQMSADRRKKLKRLCPHETSFALSEFIPWNILLSLRNNASDYLSRLKLDYTIKLYPSTKTENLSAFIKSLKMRRSQDARDVQKIWSANDCNHDENIEFYCHGRLPVFNEWISENAQQFFRKVWSSSSPVLVKRVHENLSKTLWRPEAFKEHMIDHRETPALWDCETLTPVQTNETILGQFWDGFECLNIRLKDEEHGGRPRILKLKDWPTKKDFASVFPTLLHDLMTNIPFSEYTKRSYTHDGVTYHGGAMNIVERLPSYLVKPDLGPKLYIAYSQLTSQATRKAGTTNLHIDVSDAVNVLVYVGVGGHGDDGSNKDEELRQVEAEILESNIDEAQLQRLRNGERPGALWHLFRSDDAKKIREYIGRAQRRVPGSDSIHDQTAYLEKEDLEKLRDWSKVDSYPILQFLGDAVFIPSGAPHQVKNFHSCIKIAEDFVSPENLDRCLITTNEFRSLSKTHSNHADILQAKNILYYSTRDALHSLTETATKNLFPSSSEPDASNVHI